MRSQGKPMQVARPDGHGYDSGSEPNRYREREREREREAVQWGWSVRHVGCT